MAGDSALEAGKTPGRQTEPDCGLEDVGGVVALPEADVELVLAQDDELTAPAVPIMADTWASEDSGS